MTAMSVFALTLSRAVATELCEWSIEEIRAQPIGVALCKSERSHFHGRQFISNSAVNNGTFFTRFDIIGCPRPSIGIQQLLNIMWT
jgi:hypothetical protein